MSQAILPSFITPDYVSLLLSIDIFFMTCLYIVIFCCQFIVVLYFFAMTRVLPASATFTRFSVFFAIIFDCFTYRESASYYNIEQHSINAAVLRALACHPRLRHSLDAAQVCYAPFDDARHAPSTRRYAPPRRARACAREVPLMILRAITMSTWRDRIGGNSALA